MSTQSVDGQKRKVTERSRGSLTTEDTLWTYADLQAFLQTTYSVVTKLVHRRQIPYIKLGDRRIRFDKRQVMAWLETLKKDPIDVP